MVQIFLQILQLVNLPEQAEERVFQITFFLFLGSA